MNIVRRKKLKMWRVSHDFTQRDVAKILNIATSHYSLIEQGINNPSYELLIRFEKYFKTENTLDLFEKEKD